MSQSALCLCLASVWNGAQCYSRWGVCRVGRGDGGGGNVLDWQAVRDRGVLFLRGSRRVWACPSWGPVPCVCVLSLCAKAAPAGRPRVPTPPASFLSNSVHCLAVCPATDPHPTWGYSLEFAHS